jgi:hypothetical protein
VHHQLLEGNRAVHAWKTPPLAEVMVKNNRVPLMRQVASARRRYFLVLQAQPAASSGKWRA